MYVNIEVIIFKRTELCMSICAIWGLSLCTYRRNILIYFAEAAAPKRRREGRREDIAFPSPEGRGCLPRQRIRGLTVLLMSSGWCRCSERGGKREQGLSGTNKNHSFLLESPDIPAASHRAVVTFVTGT